MTFQSVIDDKIALITRNLLISGLCFQNPAYRLARLFSISYGQSHGCLTDLSNGFPSTVLVAGESPGVNTGMQKHSSGYRVRPRAERLAKRASP